MRGILAGVFVAVTASSLSAPASAQDVGGYLTAGSGSIDYLVAREVIPQISGGVLVRFADDRFRVGAQGDVFFSNGYVSGRGGPVAEIALLPKRSRVQPFVTGGYYVADGGGLIMYGGGVDVWMTDTIGLRGAVQDAARRSTVISVFGSSSNTLHEPSIQVGVVWR